MVKEEARLFATRDGVASSSRRFSSIWFNLTCLPLLASPPPASTPHPAVRADSNVHLGEEVLEVSVPPTSFVLGPD